MLTDGHAGLVVLLVLVLLALLWWQAPFCWVCTNPVGWIPLRLDDGRRHWCCWKCASRVRRIRASRRQTRSVA